MEANQYSFLNLKVLLQKFCLFWLILGNLHVHVGITLTYSKTSQCKGAVCLRAKWPIRLELIPVSIAWSDWEYFYSPQDGMLVHHRVTPVLSSPVPFIHLGGERRREIKCVAQEHSSQSSWPGLEPGQLAPESSKLTMRPPGVVHRTI